MPSRTVEHGDHFLEEAMHLFPPGGSSDGRPSFELFEQTVLKTAETAFGLNFEALPELEPGSPVHLVLTANVLLFPRPLVFYGILTAEHVVEIVGVVQDDEWPESLGEDEW